jgi:hypothetical protein
VLQGTRRVKERSSDLPLLVKPNEPISGIRLSSGISHIKKQIYRIDTSARLGFQQLFDNLHDLARWRFRLLSSTAYLSGMLLSDCCYRAVNLFFIQIRTPSLGQVFLPYSRPLYPAAQVLYVISLSFIATMGSSDPS